MTKMTSLGFLLILPLFTIALVANYNSFASAQEEIRCISGEVTVIRVTNANPICIDKDTALKWEKYGIATIVSEDSESEPIKAPKSTLQQQSELILEKIERGERLSQSQFTTAKKAMMEQYSEGTKL